MLTCFSFFSTEHPAGSFGARHTPHIMRLHEIMGIEQNRRWGVCSLNEFRKVRLHFSFLFLCDGVLIASYEQFLGLKREFSFPLGYLSPAFLLNGFRFRQHTQASWNGTVILRSLGRLRSSMEISTTLSFTSVFRLRKSSLSWTVPVSALVRFHLPLFPSAHH